ncbi:hypothetical protein N7491_009511 [Penicillium cf. griseofulvum]|uniref:F-box domain-containing protein n=1 Tax=Penicillium cf. griseofulvum TaxID=2972120 RepID=A0A9W9ME14_9EURO|nr:hypothetical protein N7472_004895 [Penicillium cf. griseofulvum]KAJ5424295.1 hypothetical protein N7491_009511 [Penicillium cf. griseofulvum]
MGTQAHASGIHSLPVELLADIAKYTESLGLCALRLTCRALYQSSLRHFAQTCVQTIKTDLTPKSLAWLEKVANDEFFGRCVRKLEIVRNSKCCPGPCSLNITPNETYVQSWRDVMKRLVNCRSFELYYSTYTTPCPDSDGITLDWASGFILEAICTEQIPMEKFSIEIMKYRDRWDHYNIAQFGIATFGIPAFSHLKELSLVIPDAKTETINWMAKTIQGAKALRKLEILFNWGCKSTSLLSQLSSVGCLPELQELTFSRMSFDSSAALGIFLYNIRNSLRSVTFSTVELEDGGWRSILRELGGVYQLDSLVLHRVLEPNVFVSFRKIPEYALETRYLDKRLYRPFQSCLFDRDDVAFSYSGPDLNQVVRKVAALVEVP